MKNNLLAFEFANFFSSEFSKNFAAWRFVYTLNGLETFGSQPPTELKCGKFKSTESGY
jgi:hypothetical protein